MEASCSDDILNIVKYKFTNNDPINPKIIADDTVANILFRNDCLNIKQINITMEK